ncbi:hypothetical protein ACTFIY_003867 [Dictyostelium cf. discoideum]
MKSILLLLVLISSEKCLSENHYEYLITIENNGEQVYSIEVDGFGIPFTLNSTHFTMNISEITFYYSSFIALITFSWIYPYFENIIINSNFTQIELIGNGLKNNIFFNGYFPIRCIQDTNFDKSRERFLCYPCTSNQCLDFGWSNDFFGRYGIYFSSPKPTIYSIVKLGSSFFIIADFYCPLLDYEITKGISINDRESYEKKKKK